MIFKYKDYIRLVEELGDGNLPIWKDFSNYKFSKTYNDFAIDIGEDIIYFNICIDLDSPNQNIYIIGFDSANLGSVDTNYNLQYRLIAQIINIIIAFKNFMGDDIVIGYHTLKTKGIDDNRRKKFYKLYLDKNNIRYIQDDDLFAFYFNDESQSRAFLCIENLKKLLG